MYQRDIKIHIDCKKDDDTVQHHERCYVHNVFHRCSQPKHDSVLDMRDNKELGYVIVIFFKDLKGLEIVGEGCEIICFEN